MPPNMDNSHVLGLRRRVRSPTAMTAVWLGLEGGGEGSAGAGVGVRVGRSAMVGPASERAAPAGALVGAVVWYCGAGW